MIDNPYSSFDIKGKIALVIGATGAFGSVAAKTYAGAGCKVALTGGNKSELEKISDEISKVGCENISINERPSSENECQKIVNATVKKFGRIDILVVASGINKVSKVDEMSPDTFSTVMDVNVTQSWLMAREVTKQMKNQGDGGKIVLVSSARGLLGHPAGYTAYCASKSAVDGITKALGCELGDTGITVNAIAPTVFRSPLTSWMFEDNPEAQKVRSGFITRVPKGRLGEPEDLAGPLLFLSSKASDFYTGHILYADGGYTAG
tara:strand:- start:1359 stop:2150 length:792 start_codon:yes stop_codon:yes gene_type:complete